MEWVIVALRAILVPLAVACLLLNGSSILALWRGSQSLAQAGRGQVVFFAAAVLVGQIFYLIFAEPAVLLLALTLAGSGLILSLWVSWRARSKGLVRLDAMIDRPDLALPLVELAQFDPEKARELASEAHSALAQRRLEE